MLTEAMKAPRRTKQLQKLQIFAAALSITLLVPLGFYITKTQSSNVPEKVENSDVSTTEAPFTSGGQCELRPCPKTSPHLIGEFAVDFKEESLAIVEERLKILLQPGGWFTPKECKPRDKVAIIVPMRDRAYQLPPFLKNIHPMLMRQQIEYGIFVVEQTMDEDLNKGVLFNAGFTEAMKMKNWDCFIFHDIDTVPFDDRNIYSCPRDGPLHMAIGVDKFHYKLLSKDYYGGVSAFTTEQFRKINGYSTLFRNWGGEDNDLMNRVIKAGYPILRSSEKTARYKSLPHKLGKRNPNWGKQVKESDKYIHTSGLNSLEYHIKQFKIKPTHTYILIDHIPYKVPKSDGASAESPRKRTDE